MKILFLTEYFPGGNKPVFTGGVEARAWWLAEYLKDRGHKVEVKARTDNYAFNNVLNIFWRVVYFIKELIFLWFRKGKWDIVEGTNFTTYILAFLYAKRMGAKAVAWWPDVFAGQAVKRLGLVSGMAVELVERVALKLPWDRVIALSEETSKKLASQGIGSRKIKVIYGGAQSGSKFKVQSSKFRRPTVLCISRLVEYKRVGDLILAVYLLKESIPGIRLLIVGKGPMLRKLKVKSEKLKVADRINFLGRVSERKKWGLLKRSHVHLLPSVVEGFGLVTVEALSAGTPVVNADIPVNREILAKSEERRAKSEAAGGLLYPPGDYAGLAEGIERLLTDKKLYNQKVKEGKELVKKYEWSEVNRQTEGLYQRLLSD